MFRRFGHEKVSVLDGGLKGWVKAGLEVIGGPETTVEPQIYEIETADIMKVQSCDRTVIGYSELVQNLMNFNVDRPVTMIDARPGTPSILIQRVDFQGGNLNRGTFRQVTRQEVSISLFLCF